MKKLILALLFCFVAIACQAATVTLAWDANPADQAVTKYTVYEQTGATWTKLVDVTTPTVTLSNVTPGIHTYAVTASNIWLESARSASAATPNVPSAPSNMIIITITP